VVFSSSEVRSTTMNMQVQGFCSKSYLTLLKCPVFESWLLSFFPGITILASVYSKNKDEGDQMYTPW
jgi:hypothetical protein